MSKVSDDKTVADIAKAEYIRKKTFLEQDYKRWVASAASAQNAEDKARFTSLAAGVAKQLEKLDSQAPA